MNIDKKYLYIRENSRAVIYEDGNVRIPNGCEDHMITTENYRRKARIVRNAFLPRWVQDALKRGNFVKVEDIEAKNGDRGWYVVIRGKEVKVRKEKKTFNQLTRKYREGDYYVKVEEVTYESDYLLFDGVDEEIYETRKVIGQKFLYGLTMEDYEAFKNTRPKEIRNSFCYFEKEEASVYNLETDMESLTTMVYIRDIFIEKLRRIHYTDRLRDNGDHFDLLWEIFTNDTVTYRHEILSKKESRKIIKYDLLRTYTESTSAECGYSDDGYRKSYSHNDWECKVYRIEVEGIDTPFEITDKTCIRSIVT